MSNYQTKSSKGRKRFTTIRGHRETIENQWWSSYDSGCGLVSVKSPYLISERTKEDQKVFRLPVEGRLLIISLENFLLCTIGL